MEPPSTEPPAPPGITKSALGRVAFHAVASGLAPLIPVPLLDDYAQKRVREGMVRDLLKAHRLDTPDDAVRTLAGSRSQLNVGKRVRGMLGSLVLYPVKKIFRKVFFVLWLKDCVDMASASLHHGILLEHALERGHLDARSLRGDAPARVHAAIVATCKDIDPSVIHEILRRLFASSRLMLAEATRAFLSRGKVTPRAPDAKENEEVRSLADRLFEELLREPEYFAALMRRFEVAMARGR